MAAQSLLAWQTSKSINHFSCFTDLLMSLCYDGAITPPAPSSKKARKSDHGSY